MRKNLILFLCLLDPAGALDKNTLYQSALRGITYLERREKFCDLTVQIVLHYLKRRYLHKYAEGVIQKLEAVLSPQQKPLLRLIDPNYDASESLVKMVKGIDRITANALFCDRYPLPWDFYKEIETLASKGEYAATHALLALIILEERGCAKRDKRHEELRSFVLAAVEKIATLKTPLTDLQIEAILMLQLARAAVKSEWLAEVYLAQSADGSFLHNAHSTAIAAWLFLDFWHAGTAR